MKSQYLLVTVSSPNMTFVKIKFQTPSDTLYNISLEHKHSWSIGYFYRILHKCGALLLSSINMFCKIGDSLKTSKYLFNKNTCYFCF